MFEWLWSGDASIILGSFGFLMGIASLIYARSQARGANAQVESARKQAVEALLAAQLVAQGAREQAAEALRAAGLVAENARLQAVEALHAAELVANGAREQAVEALRAAGLVAENARLQAAEAVHAAELVAQGAREQAVEALRAAGLVAENARIQAVQALHAAELVAENARLQATQALRAAELLASSAVSARVREMRARNFQHNPDLPSHIRSMMKDAGGPEAYSVLLDSIDIAQEIYTLRKSGVVSDEHWRLWMNDQMVLIAGSPSFKTVFRHAADQGMLRNDFLAAFEPVFAKKAIIDPGVGTPPPTAEKTIEPNGGPPAVMKVASLAKPKEVVRRVQPGPLGAE